jgi:Tol biopolymer transport system component
MSDRLFERAVLEWLEDGSDRTPRRAIDAVLLAVKTTPQERARWRPWRNDAVSTSLRIALIVAVVAAAAGAALLLGGGTDRNSTTPAPPTPTTSVTANPTARPTATADSGLLAPLGYPGAGTIEFTRHDGVTGNDVLWIVDPSGANATKILDGACCGLWSPDGRQLAVSAPGITVPGVQRDPALAGVEVFGAPGTTVAFTVPTGCGACEMLNLNSEPDAWSPDGRYIALAMWSDTDSTQDGMALADRDATPPWDWNQVRATGTNSDIPVGFSPDGSQLLFLRTDHITGPTTFGSLFVLDVTARSVRQVSPPGVTLSANGLTQGPASWSSDGQRIVFAGVESATGTAGIYAVGSAPGATAQRLAVDAPGATSARYSPDGSLIAFDRSSGGPQHDLWVMQPDGAGAVNLTSTFSPGTCCAQWSPDSKAVVALATPSDDSHYELFVLAVDGSGIWQVTTEPNVYTGFLWGPGFR